MTEELKQKAEEWRKNYTPMGITCIERDGVVIETPSKAIRHIENPNPFRIKDGWFELYLRDLDNAYIAGATENGIQIHNLRKNPNDLPECDESKHITFYVEEWIESIQKYRKHYCLGFYKKSFMNDDVKLFVEKSKGYENEHLPKTVLFWYEIPQFKE